MGTTADLFAGDNLYLEDLLYGFFLLFSFIKKKKKYIKN